MLRNTGSMPISRREAIGLLSAGAGIGLIQGLRDGTALAFGQPGGWHAAASGTKRIPFERRPLALQRRSIQSQLWELGLKVDFELVERLRKTAGAAVNAAARVSTAIRVTFIDSSFNLGARSDAHPLGKQMVGQNR